MKKFNLRITLQMALLMLTFAQTSFGQVVSSWIENKGSFKDSIPIEYTNGRIFINLSFGKDTTQYRFLLDTGAPCAVSKELQNKFEFKTIKKIQTGTSIDGIKDSTFLVTISQIAINKIIFANSLASVIDMKYLHSKGLKIDGILGANLMKLCVWQIDLSKGYIFIADKSSRLNNIDSKSYLKFEEYGIQGSPLVNISFNDKIDEAAIFDTGSEILYTMAERVFKIAQDKSIFKSENIKKQKGNRGTVFGEYASDTLTYVFLDKLALDEKIVFKEIEVEVLSDVSLIGTKFLEQYVTTIDFKKNRIYYMPK